MASSLPRDNMGWASWPRVPLTVSTTPPGVPVTPPATGAPEVFRSTVDPTGVVSCDGPGLVIGDGAMLGKLWAKSTPGVSAADWFPLIA